MKVTQEEKKYKKANSSKNHNIKYMNKYTFLCLLTVGLEEKNNPERRYLE
jgi:hypothetical protein